MNIQTLATAAFVIAAAAAPGTAQDRNAVPVAVPTGEPARSCLPVQQIRSSHVRSDEIIDFQTRNRKFYRVTLRQGACPGLGFEKRFAYRTTISQLCSSDIITVLNTAGPQSGASCGLGEFVPVTIERKPRR